MVISYHGAEFFKISLGDVVIALNPISRESKLKTSRFGADLCFVSLDHPDCNGADLVTLGEKRPIIISGPGEYEAKGVWARGFPSESSYGGEKRINTIYLINLDNIHLCFLGALKSPVLPREVEEAIERVDVLFVPIGSEGVLGPADAEKISVGLEPRIIIPMHYGEIGVLNALRQFLKEGGAEGEKPIDKLTLKRRDLEGRDGGDIVVLAHNT